MIRSLSIYFFFIVIGASGFSADFTPAQLDFFEKKIRPVLSAKCYQCHSAEAEKLKSGLQVDHREYLLKGGDSGPALDLENPEDSFLIETISYHNPDLQMPPKEKLSDKVVADFKKWIGEGAAWPDEELPVRGEEAHVETFDLQKRFSEHWSWRPVVDPTVPGVKQSGWPKSPIDHFILHRIEEAGLRPAEAAEDRTWLRRVYFDLTGLPPTREDIESFLKDSSGKRKEKVVDGLLASPRFGEKWARHWMDLVRYAETYGHEFDYPIDYAHEYRDYLIRAFNADVPFDQFATEHIAGDLIKSPRLHPEEKFNESVLGTGFWYFHEATHAPTDVLADESDHHDNQIDVFAKSFLGLTVACARCHDHKFDAISTADYYALTGYLHSSARTERSMDPGGVRKSTAQRQLAILDELNRKGGPDFDSKIDRYFSVATGLIRERLSQKKEGAQEETEVFEDFESGFKNWEITGDAFGEGPVEKAVRGQQPVTGFVGKFFATSFAQGSDKHQGKLISKPFTVSRPFIHFRISGGRSEETSLRLQVGGETVLTASGEGVEPFRFVCWDVSKFKGKEAQFHLVDDREGSWGHVNLDHITFSNSSSNNGVTIPMVADEVIAKAAQKEKLDSVLLANWCRLFTSDEKNLTKPLGFLTSWARRAGSVNGLDKQNENLKAQQNDFKATSTLYEDFEDSELPEGWSVNGEGFRMTGESPVFSGSKEAPYLRAGLVSSRLLGESREGILRSPTFTIESDHIHVRWRAENAMARIVIDNYHMAKFNSLLFRGTTHKDVSTGGGFANLSISGGLKKYRGHRAYLEFVDRGPGFIEIDEIRFFDSNAPREALHPLVSTLVSGPDPESVDELAGALAKAAGENVPLQEWLVGHQLVPSSAYEEDLNKVSVLADRLPAPRFAVTMAEGTPENAEVYIRGSHRTPGEEVPRRFLEALGAKEGDRLELARQVVSPENPLTSRVIANRLWHHLFGKGLVPTVDDFGPMGQEPTHPELLDWIAHDFVSNGWSIKKLLREIALSQTYGQSGIAHPQLDGETLATIDPTNALLHRMPVRRLQSESIRDSIMAVSGSIDKKMFGPSVPTHRTEFMTGRGARGSGPLDGNGRRSVYGAIYRNFLPPFQLAFDMPNPFGPKGRRSVSNVPAQALALMNDPFIIEQSQRWAKNSLEKYPDLEPEQRISQMVESLTGLIPEPEKKERLNRFLENQSKLYGVLDERAWSDLAHALFNTKSFLYLN